MAVSGKKKQIYTYVRTYIHQCSNATDEQEAPRSQIHTRTKQTTDEQLPSARAPREFVGIYNNTRREERTNEQKKTVRRTERHCVYSTIPKTRSRTERWLFGVHAIYPNPSRGEKSAPTTTTKRERNTQKKTNRNRNRRNESHTANTRAHSYSRNKTEVGTIFTFQLYGFYLHFHLCFTRLDVPCALAKRYRLAIAGMDRAMPLDGTARSAPPDVALSASFFFGTKSDGERVSMCAAF